MHSITVFLENCHLMQIFQQPMNFMISILSHSLIFVLLYCFCIENALLYTRNSYCVSTDIKIYIFNIFLNIKFRILTEFVCLFSHSSKYFYHLEKSCVIPLVAIELQNLSISTRIIPSSS